MGFMNWLWGGEQKAASSLLDLLAAGGLGWRESTAGPVVTWSTALQVSTVLACVTVLANGVAQVPLKLYRARPDGRGSDPATDHPLYELLYRRPNAWQTSFQFRQTLVFHRALCGNTFVFVNRGLGGRIVELLPIEPGRVTVTRNRDMSLTYRVAGEDGSSRDFAQEAIWHLRGPSWNSWMGLEPVKLAREAIGLAMATEAAHARLHKNGARPSGILSVPEPLSPDQYVHLRDWIVRESAGDNSSGVLIVDRGAKWQAQALTGVDSQHIETRGLQVQEICRGFNVKPIMIGHPDETSNHATSEQMFLSHVVHTLGPLYEDLEQSIDVNLLDPRADRGIYAKFTVNGLLRGAVADRGDYYTKALGSGGQGGWLTQNEIRGLEELNPLPGGDELPMRQEPSAPKPKTEEDDDDAAES